MQVNLAFAFAALLLTAPLSGHRPAAFGIAHRRRLPGRIASSDPQRRRVRHLGEQAELLQLARCLQGGPGTFRAIEPVRLLGLCLSCQAAPS